MSEPLKHTPGPWAATTDGSHEVYSEAEYQSVCMVLGTNHAKADAHLIAAAPEMLAALKAVRSHQPDHGDTIWQQVEDAISKAEGRS